MLCCHRRLWIVAINIKHVHFLRIDNASIFWSRHPCESIRADKSDSLQLLLIAALSIKIHTYITNITNIIVGTITWNIEFND